MNPTHTDPLFSITEGIFNKNKNVLDAEEMPDAKDITPTEEPKQTSLRDVVMAYNSADLHTQLEFVKLLAIHDLDKLQYALKGK